MSTYLSEHFSLEELTTTEQRTIDNRAPQVIVEALRETAQRMEVVRTLLEGPIHVNSGYRCPRLNTKIGGAKNSAHLTGHAVDFICPKVGTTLAVCRLIQSSTIEFDQLIEEGSWVHISFDPRMRGEVLTKNPKGGYTQGLR